MIKIQARDKNRIVTAIVPGKMPIKIRPGASLYFWSPMEMLCGAVGGCVGGIVVDYCRYNNLDPSIFEFLGTDLDEGQITITLQHPKDLEKEHLDRLVNQIESCEISKMLNNSLKIKLIHNTTSTKELTDESKRIKGCCGSYSS